MDHLCRLDPNLDKKFNFPGLKQTSHSSLSESGQAPSKEAAEKTKSSNSSEQLFTIKFGFPRPSPLESQ